MMASRDTGRASRDPAPRAQPGDLSASHPPHGSIPALTIAAAGIPLSIGIGIFVIMATWRWGRKATFAAYSAKETMTIAELIQFHRKRRLFLWSARQCY